MNEIEVREIKEAIAASDDAIAKVTSIRRQLENKLKYMMKECR